MLPFSHLWPLLLVSPPGFAEQQKIFFLPRLSILYLQFYHPELFISAALCLIISITAALRRESDCCCSLLRCSFKSLKKYIHHYNRLYNTQRMREEGGLLREVNLKTHNKEKLLTNLQRGTWHSDSLQARAWSCRRYHIFLQRTQPPDARTLHWIPWRKSPLTFRQLGYVHCAERHCDACTRRSSILLSCKSEKKKKQMLVITIWPSRTLCHQKPFLDYTSMLRLINQHCLLYWFYWCLQSNCICSFSHKIIVVTETTQANKMH